MTTSARGFAPLRLLDRAVERLEQGILVGGILAMALLNIANVISRNLLGGSMSFAEEANQGLIVLVTFMGLGYGVRRARHIRMSAFYDQLRGRARKALMTGIAAGTAALLLLLAWFAVVHVQQLYQSGTVTPALRVPVYLIQLSVPVGLLLGAAQYLLTVCRNLTTEGTWLSFTEPDVYHEAEPESASC